MQLLPNSPMSAYTEASSDPAFVNFTPAWKEGTVTMPTHTTVHETCVTEPKKTEKTTEMRYNPTLHMKLKD